MHRFGRWWLLILLVGTTCLHGQYSPPGSPQFTTTWYANTQALDAIFIGGYRVAPPFYLKATEFLLDSRGQTIWYHQGDHWTYDFKLHPNGKMAFNDVPGWQVLDSNFEKVDSITCKGGYDTDEHDFLMTADGHYFLICIEDTTMDLTALPTANLGYGPPDGRVEAVVIQELDGAQNVVKEWHGLDHFQLSDQDSSWYENPYRFELNHTNSIDLDANGRMLFSHRAMNEVTLIDWTTGQIIWRLGGKNNQFDLLRDPPTKGQHDARFLGGDRISLFDNGYDAHIPRGLIYRLDTVAWTATVDWQYQFANTFSNGMGNMRVQPDGDALISLGFLTPYSEPQITFVAADSTKIFDIHFADTSATYRVQASTLPFGLHRPVLTCEYISGQVILGLEDPATDYQWNTGETSASITVTSPGWYQAFVPKGIGMMGTEPLEITNLSNACLALAQQSAMAPRPTAKKRMGYFDLMGRPVSRPEPWQVVIERFDDGSGRKMVLGN
jgi:hypothetical protein